MSEVETITLSEILSPAGIAQIDAWISKYPPEERQSAVMAALMIAQEEKGYLTPELMDLIAVYLNMPAVAVYEVATFYSMYELKPIGKKLINVCTNVSCKLAGAAKVVDYLESKLQIKLGQTTHDGEYTLRAVECLGACIGAPMMQVNKDYHENLTPEKIDQVLEQYR